jgi:hypothetical protein
MGMMRPLWALALVPLLLTPQPVPYESMAARAVGAMKPVSGERVLIRVDPKTMPDFAPVLRAAFERAGAKVYVASGAVIDGLEGVSQIPPACTIIPPAISRLRPHRSTSGPVNTCRNPYAAGHARA